MKKTFIITIEYPDCDHIPTDEIIEVLEERMDSIGDYLDANIMDGVKDRLFTTVCSGNAIIDKACEWITEHIDIPYEGEYIDDSPVASDYIEWCEKRLEYAKAVADAFKQAMEE